MVADGHEILGATARQLLLRYRNRDGKVAVRLAPGESYRLTRRVIPGANLFDVRRVADRIAGKDDQRSNSRSRTRPAGPSPRPTSCWPATAGRSRGADTDEAGRSRSPPAMAPAR